MTQHFGEHLTIDGYNADPDLLDSKELVLSVLQELPKALDMHILSEPLVVVAPDNQLKDPGGLSGFVIIAESHISLHTFPKRKFLSADVYTCQNGLDQQYVLNYLKKAFKIEQLEINFIKRGLMYPSENLI